jgi:hypothetical protein
MDLILFYGFKNANFLGQFDRVIKNVFYHESLLWNLRGFLENGSVHKFFFSNKNSGGFAFENFPKKVPQNMNNPNLKIMIHIFIIY